MRRGLTVVISVAAVVVSTISFVAPAQAVGNNRTVSRGCGKNYVSSSRYSEGGGWAQTQKQSGDCKGRLSAALQLSSGYRTPRVYGSNLSAFDSTDLGVVVNGLHWGFDNCDLTTS